MRIYQPYAVVSVEERGAKDQQVLQHELLTGHSPIFPLLCWQPTRAILYGCSVEENMLFRLVCGQYARNYIIPSTLLYAA